MTEDARYDEPAADAPSEEAMRADAWEQGATRDAVSEARAADAERDLRELTYCASRTDMGYGYVAHESVDSDGNTVLWLVDQRHPRGGQWDSDMAPHERTGPLPREWKQRSGLTCSATRRNGQPCQQTVKTQGALCRFHAEPGS